MIDQKKLDKLNDAVYQNGGVDREHILTFLTLVGTNDGRVIAEEMKKWLAGLHKDPKYDKVNFPQGDIDQIVSDLDSYGRVQPDPLIEFRTPDRGPRAV